MGNTKNDKVSGKTHCCCKQEAANHNNVNVKFVNRLDEDLRTYGHKIEGDISSLSNLVNLEQLVIADSHGPKSLISGDLTSLDDLKKLKKEVRIDYYKSSGPGGQHKNKTMSCVRLCNKPTGIRVIATESRSQIKNRELAFKRLQVKLMELNIKEKERIPTTKPRYVKEQILQNKKKRSEKKQSRKRVSGEDKE